MNNEKLEILDTDELLELYLNFSDLHVSKNFLIFESKFSTYYEKPKPSISYIDDELLKIFSDLRPKWIEVLNKRLLEEKTLNETGKELSITRERVRQIEQQAIKSVNFHAKNLIIDTLSELVENPMLNINELFIKDENLKLLYCGSISHPQSKTGIIFDKDMMTLVENNDLTFQGIVSKIEYTFKDTNKSLFYLEDLIDYLQSIFPKISNFEHLIEILLEKNKLRIIGTSQYFFHYLYKPKRPMVDFIFSLYPGGLFLHQQKAFIKAELDKYFPNVFIATNKNRNITTAAGSSQNILLWDWGKYIHIEYILPILEEYDFSNVLHYIDDTLGETQIDLQFCFDKYEKELCAIGIPNKFALHTCLKLKFPDDYTYQDSPWISKAGTERRSLSVTLMNLIDEDRIYTLDELVLSMKTTKLRIQQLIDYSNDVIVIDTFKYKNRKFIELPDNLITQLIQYANSKVLGLEFFYVELIVNAFSEQLKAYSQYDISTVVLELLKKCSKATNFNISNTRIVNKDYLITKDSLNFHVIINNLLSNKDTLSINDISNYFSRRGLSSKLITAYFTQSKIKMIVRLDRETYTSIGKIGIENNNIEDINLLMENIIDSETYIEDLLDTVKLPKISVEWNRYIFTDLMFNDKFSFSPNRENPRYIHKKQ